MALGADPCPPGPAGPAARGLRSRECGRDPGESSLDPTRPRLRIGTSRKAHQGGLVDQPPGYRHASSVVSVSARSVNRSANERRSSTQTGAPELPASAARRRRMYSTRDRPRRAAWASTPASTDAGTPRISTSASSTTFGYLTTSDGRGLSAGPRRTDCQFELQARDQIAAGTWESSGRVPGSLVDVVPHTSARSFGIQNWPSASNTSVTA